MKKYLSILTGLVLTFTAVSCDDYLNINTDPDNPTAITASDDVRLPWIQHYLGYAMGTAAHRTNTILGLLGQTAGTAANSRLAAWDPAQSSCTTVYQNFYVGAAVNIDPMIAKALELQEFHYAGAGYTLKAMGFMLMLDMHGELPIQEAFILKTNPKYDDGKKMYQLIMGYLDEALKYFEMTQSTGVTPLSEGDTWNGGDIDKWKKLVHGLKARYMLRLSKKAEGKGLFDFNMDGILAEIALGPQSNSDNTIVKHENMAGDQTNFTVADPYRANYLWDAAAYGSTQRTTRYYANMLNNTFTGGSMVVDPRASKLLPAMMSKIVLTAGGAIATYEWRRDVGLDMMNSPVRQQGGPLQTIFVTSNAGATIEYVIEDPTALGTFIAAASLIHDVTVKGETVAVKYQKGAAYVNSTDYRRAGDTIYVNFRSNHMDTGGRAVNNQFYYPSSSTDFVGGTGNFFARPTSDTYMMTYAEMCFIKAEVLFRKGDSGGALAAYKAGIQASFDQMQTKLNQWAAGGTVNPDEKPMNNADIVAYMSSAAVVQAAGDLKMSDIMRQKMIAMGFDCENWVDARRFNYSAGDIKNFGVVYIDYKRPQEFTKTAVIVGTSPTDPTYWFRRFNQSTHESNYNSSQLKASHALAMKDAIWSCPVWWDCATDDEYYGYGATKTFSE